MDQVLAWQRINMPFICYSIARTISLFVAGFSPCVCVHVEATDDLHMQVP